MELFVDKITMENRHTMTILSREMTGGKQIVGRMIWQQVICRLGRMKEKQGVCNRSEKSCKTNMVAGEEMVNMGDFGCDKE